MKIPYFTYQEKKIYFEIKESKANKAIIFVHGSGSGSQVWKNQMDLDLDYNIIALDLPSHFNSEYFSQISLDLYVDVVVSLIDHLRYQEVVLCGHSLGGAIIQALYFKYPNYVKGLILVGTGGRLRVGKPILGGAFHRKASTEIVQDYVNETSKLKNVVVYADYKICDGFDTLNKTSTINVPCLILCGKGDILTPVKYSEYFKEKIKNSRLRETR